MKKSLKLFVTSSLLIVLSFSSKAFAHELIIQDTNGNIRHVAEVNGKANVRLTVTNLSGQPVEGSEIRLEYIESTANDAPIPDERTKNSRVVVGLAEFRDVTPGKWIVSANSDSVVLASLDVLDPNAMMAQGAEPMTTILGIEMAESTAIVVGGTIGVVVGVGAAVGIGFAIDDALDDDENDPPSGRPVSPFL